MIQQLKEECIEFKFSGIVRNTIFRRAGAHKVAVPARSFHQITPRMHGVASNAEERVRSIWRKAEVHGEQLDRVYTLVLELNRNYL